MKYTLSRYLPKNSRYFYGFPAGEDSEFFNNVPAWKEELVAARPFVCAGPDVKVIAFAASTSPKARKLMSEMGVRLSKNIIVLPKEIAAGVVGRKRNKAVKNALVKLGLHNSLFMAQPYLSDALKPSYRISPDLSIWCNDKKQMGEYIPKAFLPKRYKTFSDGKDFFNHANGNTPLPCVIKVSSSSSGDGVRICKNATQLDAARKKFKKIRGCIFIEEYIDLEHNLGIQFAVPHNKKEPIEVIGINEQLTTKEGEYLGSIIDKDQVIPQAQQISEFMLENILPAIREKGWFGVGGLDVLIDKNGKFFFIDCNFRMTAMTAYQYLVKSDVIGRSIATFTGSFNGNEQEFRKVIFPLAKKGPRQSIQIIALTEHERQDGYHFNAAMFFNDRTEIPDKAKKLLKSGIKSSVLRRLSRNTFV